VEKREKGNPWAKTGRQPQVSTARTIKKLVTPNEISSNNGKGGSQKQGREGRTEEGEERKAGGDG